MINVAPSDCRLSNTSWYDLAIAVGIIAASGQRDLPELDKFLVCGELGLDGAVRDTPNVADIADITVWKELKGCILPKKAAMYNSRNEAIDVFSVDNLSDAIGILSGQTDCSHMLARKHE